MKYMLITVCDRSISTEKFHTFEDARAKMMDELMDELFYSDAVYELAEVEGVFDEDGMPDNEAAWNKIKDLTEYNGDEISEYGFSFCINSARCETDGDYPFSWKIVEI